MISDEISGNYEDKSFVVPTPSTDLSWRTAATAFVKFPSAKSAVIRSDQPLTFKFARDPARDGIAVLAVEFPFSMTGLLFEDILITNASGFAANVSILLR